MRTTDPDHAPDARPRSSAPLRCLRALEQDPHGAHEDAVLEELDDAGLIWRFREGEPVRLTRAGRQYLARDGEVDAEVLSFLPRWVDDLHARAALREAGAAVIDTFRDELAAGTGAAHAQWLVPEHHEADVDERVAVNLFAAAVALVARLGQGLAAACLGEEVMAVAVVGQATSMLMDEALGLDPDETAAAVDALDGVYDLFQDDDVLGLWSTQWPHDPDDGPDPRRPATWFSPWAGQRDEGYLEAEGPVAAGAGGPRATTVPLHLSIDPEWDLVEVLAFGTICDRIAAGRYVTLVEDRVALVLDPALREAVGFVVDRRSALTEADLETPGLWEGPRFRVPVLGLTGASVGEILTAIGGRFEPDEPTADAMHMHHAISYARDEAQALPHWRLALEAGDMKAHYGLGYTLCGLGLFREAYDHLRHYTELTPTNAWAWCWFGQACAGAGNDREARAAFLEAIRLGPDETDAAEHLERLDG